VIAEFVGALIAAGAIRFLYPRIASVAGDSIVPREAAS